MKTSLVPVIVGASQFTQSKSLSDPLDPLRLMVKTSENVISKAGTGEIKRYIDTIYMVNIQSWSYKDAPGKLSEILNLKPSQKVYLSDGGNTPQMLMNRAVLEISSGNSKGVLITGAEASYSVYRAKKGEIKLNWPEKEESSYMEGEIWHGTNEFENRYELITPTYSYAVFETALRAKSNRSIIQHNYYIGNLFKRFADIASRNPYAWIKPDFSVEDIITPSSENRNICHPYTKRMCSNVFIDQAGSLIITNESIAEQLNINKQKWVYHMGGSDLQNVFNITQRPSLTASPASREGVKLALQQAGLELNDINKFDIYSCFPSIVEIIMDEIGLQADDPRDLTVTGGLAYFGGPWSNYSLHAIITSIELIQKTPNLKIMVIANGGYNTKQSFGIYGNRPPYMAWNKKKAEKIQKKILKKSLSLPVEKADGRFKIEGYTLIYNRQGDPVKGIAIGNLNNGKRTLAYIHASKDKLKEIEKKELVRTIFPIKFNKELNRNVILMPN
ncbi:MAG: hypothetical protein ACFFBZ_02590 [Promethearchaeota archaeon]